jgi:hypothetical protein
MGQREVFFVEMVVRHGVCVVLRWEQENDVVAVHHTPALGVGHE